MPTKKQTQTEVIYGRFTDYTHTKNAKGFPVWEIQVPAGKCKEGDSVMMLKNKERTVSPMVLGKLIGTVTTVQGYVVDIFAKNDQLAQQASEAYFAQFLALETAQRTLATQQ